MDLNSNLTRQTSEGVAALQAAGVWIVVPCFRVKAHILDVLSKVPAWVEGVVVVDDCCPERSGEFVRQNVSDPRVRIVWHEQNQGVGGATLTGYKAAIAGNAQVIVKVDGDDQMDLRWLPALVLPIICGLADYTKGNRFSSSVHVKGMPFVRAFGNASLSILSKISTGYWNVFDPTNGYTAIDARVGQAVLEKNVAKRYFFESDMLYHLGTLRAVVKDVLMPARYLDEKSNLSAWKVLLPFLLRHTTNTAKRFVGQYIVRDFSVASIEFILGLTLLGFGSVFALVWFAQYASPQPASAGVVMAAALPIILGVQFLLAAINFDVLSVPKEPIHPTLRAADDLLMLAEASASMEAMQSDAHRRTSTALT